MILWKFKKIFQRHEQNKNTLDAVEALVEKSKIGIKFFVMCALSGLLATIGILLNDTATLIAAMVLAPLLGPILAFAAGVSVRSRKLIIYSTKGIFGGLLFTILIAAAFVKILILLKYDYDISFFISKFSEINPLFLIAAYISGFAGIYAWLRVSDKLNLVGVAIAVSLVPFVSFFGILLGMSKYEKIKEAALMFGLNLFFIMFGAVIAFLILGFDHFKKEVDKEVDEQNIE